MTGLAALTILVVDDNPQMRTIVGTVLAAAGVRRLHYAPDGLAGIRAAAACQPDVCFVDYEMPVMNGLDFIAALRSQPAPLRFAPIIMLTGHSDELRLRRARDLGVTEFLCKPVSASTILRRLETVILKPRPFVQSSDFFGPDRRRLKLVDYAGPRRRSTDGAVLEL